jgi:acetyl esterase/lipase
MLRRILAVALAAGSAPASALPLPPRPEHDVIAQSVVVTLPGMDRATVRKDVPYRRTDSGASLALDLYYPPDFRDVSRLPAVVFINGIGDPVLPSKLKEWAPYRSWGRLVAASGWIGVTFENGGRFPDSRPDIRSVFTFLRERGASLGIDPRRMAAWVCSGNVVTGLPFLMEDAEGLRGAVVYYGSGTPARYRTDLPVFFVRAGRDNPQLNAQIDDVLAKAAAAGAPWTVVRAPGSHHAFDVLDETEESRRIVRQTLDFYRSLFDPPAPPAARSESKSALGHWFAREYADAAAAYAGYVKTHPDDETAYLRLGVSQAHAGKPAEAIASLEKALSLGANRPNDLYNAACGYALSGKNDRALDLLENAVAGGFGTRELLSTDHDLDPLRSSPRFQALLERAKQ